MKEKLPESSWNRRDIICQVLLPAAAGLTLLGVGGCTDKPEILEADKRVTGTAGPDLVTIRNGEPADLVKRALAELGGMKRFVSRGDIVVLKPNIGFNRVPEQAANTNPLVVRELAIQAMEAGARRVTVLDHTLYEPRNCYTRSGIAAAISDIGVELEFVEERKFVSVDMKGAWLTRWPIYRSVLEADRVINIPVAKQHSASRLSLGMKNLMGIIGGKRESFHQNIHVALADLSAYFRPTLTVLDAYRILTRNGPQGGSLDDASLIKTLAAGTDPVAVDAFGCSLFGLAPQQLGCLREAQARNLGTFELNRLQVKAVSL